MAGHPTIGSTFALAAEGHHRGGTRRLRVRARRRTDAGFARMDGRPTGLRVDDAARCRPSATTSDAGRACRRARTGRDGHRAGASGAGRSPAACRFSSCRSPRGMPSTACRSIGAPSPRPAGRAGFDELPVFLFTTDRQGASGDETVYSRMLAPGFGIVEDPATGSASGPLGCYLVKHGVLDAGRARSFVSLQGVAMRRPSRMLISIDSDDGAITRVRVGGQAVCVGEGTIRVRFGSLVLPVPGLSFREPLDGLIEAALARLRALGFGDPLQYSRRWLGLNASNWRAPSCSSLPRP